MAMELVKENIECEQLLGENYCDTVVKSEYVIPDTDPDVVEILMLDAKPSITGKEVMQDKVYLEGQIEYNVLYQAKEDESFGVYSVTYIGKFSNYIEIAKAEHRMQCDAECYVEHMDCNIVNERKIGIEGIVKLKAEVYSNYNYEVINDVSGIEDVQMLKNPATMDKTVGSVSGDMVAKTQMQISSDKPQIGTILKQDVFVNRKDVKVLEEKVQVDANVHFGLLYRAKDSRDIEYMDSDIPVSRQMDLKDADPSMDNYTDFNVQAVQFDVKEDDLGERRIVDIEALINANSKVMYKKDIDLVEDAYSPSVVMNMKKQDYEINVIHGHSMEETIIKGNIEVNPNIRITNIIMSSGKVCVVDKKIVEDKVVVDGVLNVTVMFKTDEDGKNIRTVTEEMPFSCSVEIPGCKIDMQCIAKAFLENIDSTIEANTVAVKAISLVYVRVNYTAHKDFLVDMVPTEGETPKKKSSVSIYVVQQGDTLWKIAKNYTTTIDNLINVNKIENADTVKPGEKLIIPGRAVM